jgi:hypothetical protein
MAPKRRSPAAVSRPATPSIAQVVPAYLESLPARRRREAAFGLELLQDCLNGYGYQSLKPAERRLYEHHFNQDGSGHRDYCDLFGPEKVVPELTQFLGWFLIRKVMAGPEDLARIARETGHFVTWLGAQGHIPSTVATVAARLAASAAEALPRAEQVAHLLGPDLAAADIPEDAIEGQFRVARLAPGRLWLESDEDGRNYGPLAVPARVSQLLAVGWELSGAIGRAGRAWKVLEVWNVYPALEP